MTRWRHEAHLLMVRDDGRLFVLARTGRIPVVLQGTALAVWQALDGHSVDEAVAELSRRYGQSPARIHDEVQACADELASQGLLRVGTEGTDDDG